MKPKTNLRLRSNVYVRRGDLRDDVSFRSRVHGREALNRMLKAIEVYDSPDRAERWLTPEQLVEWRQQNRCAMCKHIVYGPVRTGTAVYWEFRCPHGSCPYDK